MAYKIEYKKWFERLESHKHWFSVDRKDEYFSDRALAVERLRAYASEKSYLSFYDPVVLDMDEWRARLIKL